jgi:hypothetical protein
MKKKIIFTLLVLILVSLTIYLVIIFTRTSQSVDNSLLSYQDQKYSFSFQYPKTWIIYDFDQDIEYMKTTGYSFKRLTISSPDYQNIYSGGDWGVNSIQGGQLNFVVSFNSYETLDEIQAQEQLLGPISKIKIDGTDALKSIYGNSIKVYFVKNVNYQVKPVYVSLEMSFDLSRKDEFVKTFDQILNSIKL